MPSVPESLVAAGKASAAPAERTPTRRAGRVAAFGAALLLGFPIATGCLYWLRAVLTGVPSPAGVEALVLDSLAAHNRVPMIPYVIVYAVVFGLVGLLARWAALDRLTAALAMAGVTGALTFVLDAVSIFVVRQVSYGQAFAEATHLQPVYLNAMIAGMAGALIARQRAARSRPARLFALAVGLAGLMELVSAVVPSFAGRLAGLDGFAPTPPPPVANALVVPLGVVLLLCARALSRGSRRAWAIAAFVLAFSSVLHVVDFYDYNTAVVCGILFLALLARRRDFTSKGAPGTRPQAIIRLLVVVAVAYGYALTALVVDRSALGLPIPLGRAATVAATALIGLPRRPSSFTGPGGSDWFYWSVASIVAIGVGWAVASWLAPWRHLLFRSEARRARVAEMVRRYGTDTLAPFALRADKAHFLFPAPQPEDESAEVVIAYRVIRGVAIVSGDPIGPESAIEPAFSLFLQQARERAWKVAVLGASDRWLPAYRRAGLRAIYHGEEAQVLTGDFVLDVPAMRTVRQAVHRVERAGYRPEVVYAGAVSPVLAAELADVERLWLNGARRTGFAMELDDLFRLGGQDAVFVIGRSRNGEIGGFLHAAVCPASRSLSLSCLPRRPDTPNGFSAWVVTKAIEWAREEGYGVISLNFAPFAGLLGREEDLSALQRLEREALLAAKSRLSLQLDNLMRFNRQFSPRLQPRYVVFERRSDLPRVTLAAMAAEGYLPFADFARGRFWPVRNAGPAEQETGVEAGRAPTGHSGTSRRPPSKEPDGDRTEGPEEEALPV